MKNSSRNRHKNRLLLNQFDTLWLRAISKAELHELIEQVKQNDTEAVRKAVLFVCAESFGIWHNRARAKLCRYFKNHVPALEQCRYLVEAISKRLIEGRFSEQFKDQLAMAIRFDAQRMTESAEAAFRSEKQYIRRYGEWTRQKIAATTRR